PDFANEITEGTPTRRERGRRRARPYAMIATSLQEAAMRWFFSKKADFGRFKNVSPEMAETMRRSFEATGVASIQLAVVNGGLIFNGSTVTGLGTGVYAEMAFEWLREQRE